MKVFGRERSPRVLLFRLTDDLAARLAPLCRTSLPIDELHQVEQAEWDAVVTSSWAEFEPHLFVLSIGADWLGHAEGLATPLDRRGQTVAREMTPGSGLADEVAALVESDLIPKARERNRNRYITYHSTSMVGHGAKVSAPPLRPFLSTTQGEVLAASFRRDGGKADLWTLPEASDPVAWLRVALEEWGKVHPLRFSSVQFWAERPEWQTKEEAAAAEVLAEAHRRRKEAQAQFEREEEAARGLLENAQRQAETGLRRLLTARSQPLVDAVADALETLGFHVRRMDPVWKDGERREDLRLTVDEDPSWEAIVEVSGVSGGGKGYDLMALNRFFALYENDEGRPASAAWYVVNHFRKRDPSERPTDVLPSNPDLVDYLVKVANGLVLSTADLFRLVRRVEEKELAAEDVRASLRSSTGQYVPPS